MEKLSDVRWSEVARRAIVVRLGRLEGPLAYYASMSELRDMIAKADVDLEKIPVEKAIRHYRKMKELEWKRISTIRAN